MDSITEKNLANFVETQFPEFYLTDGPTFILFVKKYYEWLEGSQEVAVPFAKGTVSFTSANNVVSGKNTFFESQFEAGDKIGLFYDNTDDSYEIFTIESITNDIQLVLDSDVLPSYTANNALYGTVKVEYNPNYHIRRLREYSDVDLTTNEFILYFKEKYLKNIQFTTKTNTRQLIKHSLDLYRTKGTPRGLDLLFRLVFGTSVKIYYPGTDVFKTSVGQWFVPQYLELSLKDATTSFVNKQITGLTSGATAFVESVVRRNVKGKFVDLVYISSINGNFVTNEVINLSVNPIDIEEAPVTIGSLTEIEVDADGTGSGYIVGDIVNVEGRKGTGALARVANVSSIVGTVNFDFIDGGYGYKPDSEVAISEKVLILDNVKVDGLNGAYFAFTEQVYQPLANISYINANGTFNALDSIRAFDTSNTLVGNGFILSTSATNSTSGTLLCSVVNGTLDSNYLTTTGNTVVANIASFTDKTAVGNVVGTGSNVAIRVSGVNPAAYAVGESVYQFNEVSQRDSANGIIAVYTPDIGGHAIVRLVNCHGAFNSNTPLLTKSGNSAANIISISLTVGVKDITNDFFANGGVMHGNTFLTSGNVSVLSTGTGATFELSNSFNYTEDVEVAVDRLADFASVALNASAYGLAGNASANLGSIIDDSLGFELMTFGRLSAIKGQAIGTDYNLAPIVRVYDKDAVSFGGQDFIMILDTFATNFKVGELVTQSATDGRGIVTAVSGNTMYVENLRISPDKAIILTSNSTTNIVGQDSAVTANVIYIAADEGKEPIGLNAEIDADTRTANGAITKLQLVDSGLSFVEGESVAISGESGNSAGMGFARLGRSGKSKGFYRQKGGFLSDTKKLFDGLYYQDYSYEIRSSITLDRYEEMLRKIMHIPGTKYFGSLVYDTVYETKIDARSTIITQS